MSLVSGPMGMLLFGVAFWVLGFLTGRLIKWLSSRGVSKRQNNMPEVVLVGEYIKSGEKAQPDNEIGYKHIEAVCKAGSLVAKKVEPGHILVGLVLLAALSARRH